jgi:thermitase
MLKAGGIGAAAGFVIALGLGFLLLAVGAGAGELPRLSVSGPARAAPLWPADTLPIRPSDSITPYLYLPLVMRAYRPPPPPPVYPNDPYYGSQWGLTRVRAPEAWALSTGQGVLIAVLDTGTDYTHPDLSGKVRTDIDRDFVNNDDDAMDNNGHGTHVSGIAAAATNNSRGVAGMGWDASILPLKVLDSGGNGRTDQLISAIYYAADHGARVINMSLGGPYSCLSDLQAAVDYAYSRGVLLVAAAGNWPYIAQSPFPANCAHVLGVAATTSSDSRAWFSNYGDHVSVAAPGEDIYSTLRYGGYGDMDGTSMATPFVAGLAALVYARFPTYTPGQAASAILDNAQDLGSTGWDPDYGCGRIDAFRALWEGARGDYPVCLGARVWSATGAGEQGSGGAGEPGGGGAGEPEGGGAEAQRGRGAEEQRGMGAEEQRSAGAGEVIPGEVVVTLRAGARAEALFRAQGLDPAGALLYRARSGIQVWRLRVPVGQEEAVLARLRADPAVIAADRNYRIRAQ